MTMWEEILLPHWDIPTPPKKKKTQIGEFTKPECADNKTDLGDKLVE